MPVPKVSRAAGTGRFSSKCVQTIYQMSQAGAMVKLPLVGKIGAYDWTETQLKSPEARLSLL